MKILAINIPNLDLSYFAKRGFGIEVEHITISEKFPLKHLYEVKDGSGQMVKLYTPDVHNYLDAKYTKYEYAGILVGYNSSDYGSELKNTGGYTYWQPLKCGTFWATVRDGQTSYAVHEMHHIICDIINIKLGNRTPIDFMDETPTGQGWLPYYKDSTPDDPESNHAKTWENIIPWIPKLQAIKYDTMPSVTLKRAYNNDFQQLGDLSIGSFNCKTLERPWRNNQANISCIPTGTYQVKYTFSWKFMKYTYEILNVPDRKGIRIHSGNYFFDIEGCIILGAKYGDLNHDSSADILESSKTIAEFEKYMGKKDFILTIR